MCFSATASFVAASVLVPVGIYCLRSSNQVDRRYLAFAMLPLIFGLQQMLEGGLWLALAQGDAGAAHNLALGFLFFSHVFWMGWMGYSAYLVEEKPRLRLLFLSISVFGVLLGAAMYVPLLFNDAWMVATIVQHSVHYQLSFVTDGYVSQLLISLLYTCVILTPLLLSSDRYHNRLGGLALVSGIVTWALYDWAFVSVWCYFGALISLYIFYVIVRAEQKHYQEKVDASLL
jgi:hypothetical protein